MLGLQVHAPGHGVFKGLSALLEDVDGVGVGAAGELAAYDGIQPVDEALFHEAVEEGHLLRGFGQHAGDDVLEHVLGQGHVVKEVREGDFRLHHPEFRRVARGVALLGAEGGAEGVHVAERHAEGLHVELAAHGQAGLLAEEILRVIGLAVRGEGHLVQRQGGHLKHLARALAVAGGDDGGMHVHKAALGKEGVQKLRRQRPDAEHRVKRVGAGTKVRDGAQELKGVALFLQGEVRGAQAQHLDLGGLDLEGLLHAGGEHELAGHADGAAQRDLDRAGEVAGVAVLQDDLEVFEAGAVVELDEAERLAVAHGAHPAGYGAFLDARLRGREVQVPNVQIRHEKETSSISLSKKLACGDLFRQNAFPLRFQRGRGNAQGNLAAQGFRIHRTCRWIRISLGGLRPSKPLKWVFDRKARPRRPFPPESRFSRRSVPISPQAWRPSMAAPIMPASAPSRAISTRE